ncbi:MAG: hypothetical protein F6K62_14530 [Sphaerospermopsis sp. SIO1G2]|nr:hypothetical protein [Sphaerospermopsis sp. SIO1G2]
MSTELPLSNEELTIKVSDISEKFRVAKEKQLDRWNELSGQMGMYGLQIEGLQKAVAKVEHDVADAASETVKIASSLDRIESLLTGTLGDDGISVRLASLEKIKNENEVRAARLEDKVSSLETDNEKLETQINSLSKPVLLISGGALVLSILIPVILGNISGPTKDATSIQQKR